LTDVVVAGSGAAGLAAALAAAQSGARVTMLEATPTVGGSTALSSGAMWVPGNHLHAADTADDARRYLAALAGGDTSAAAVTQFLRYAPRMARWLHESASLALTVIPLPDNHAELPGASARPGRSLEPGPVSVSPAAEALLRPPLPWRPPLTLAELLAGNVPPELPAQRRASGVVAGGQALVAALLHAVLDAGVDVRTSARVSRLGPGGVVVDGELIRGRIVLATGGYERDPGLSAAFLPVPPRGLIGAPGARGDGLRMAMAAGAELGNMADAWWCPTIEIPGDTIDGQPLHRILFAERSRPGTIMVDQRGRRFVDEAQNYCDVGRALNAFDPGGFRFPRDPSWLLFDAEYRSRYPVGPVRPADPDPAWLRRAPSIEALAAAIEVPADSLAATVRDFNTDAERGADPVFGRGTRLFDRMMGDSSAPHPSLRALSAPPYYAVRVHSGVGGTKGGPRIDADGRVRHVHGGLVPGLYAAGNAAAGPFGLAYPGMGATISLALTFGALAGRAAATDPAPGDQRA
jgi:hypothetical protein